LRHSADLLHDSQLSVLCPTIGQLMLTLQCQMSWHINSFYLHTAQQHAIYE